MKRRAHSHDYSTPGTYMLTIVIKGRHPYLGRLVASPEPHVELSQYGLTIASDEVPKISRYYPMVKVLRVCMMPDHIHMIVSVREHLPPNKHLGHVIAGFKQGCNRAFWHMIDDTGIGVFEPGYNDKLLINGDHLRRWKQYMTDNPRRLFLKRSHPDYFTSIHDMDVRGHSCHVFGNRFLLDIPDKVAIIVHRADSDNVYQENVLRWLACGERGGVLVSAAIAERERRVLHLAMERGYNIIWLRECGFPELYKPSGRTFDACAAGRLLEISPWDYHYDRRTITRQQCLQLNALATDIARGQG